MNMMGRHSAHSDGIVGMHEEHQGTCSLERL